MMISRCRYTSTSHSTTIRFLLLLITVLGLATLANGQVLEDRVDSVDTVVDEQCIEEEQEKGEPLAQENGLYVLPPSFLEEPEWFAQRILSQEEQLHKVQIETPSDRFLLLLIIYDPTCPHSMNVLHRVEESSLLMNEYLEKQSTTTNDPAMSSTVAYAKIDASDEAELLRDYSIDSFPTLIFATKATRTTDHESTSEEARNGGNTLLLEYTGLQHSAQEIFRATLHYYMRLVLGSGSIESKGDVVQVSPREFETLKDFHDFLSANYLVNENLSHHTNLPQGLPPGLEKDNADYLKWLLREETAEETKAFGSSSSRLLANPRLGLPDDFNAVIFCRNPSDHDLYEGFVEVSRAISNRRNVLFASVSKCPPMAKNIRVHRLPMDPNASLQQIGVATFDANTIDELNEFMVKIFTPSVLFLDRQTTAPIAFPLYRKVHAVLFVNLHNYRDEDQRALTRKSVGQFRRFCRHHQYKMRKQEELIEKDMVCLVVPSTETRILHAFGIDVWTAYDVQVTNPQADIDTQTLPSMLITDSRNSSMLRYYLDAGDIRARPDSAVVDFLDGFWKGSLTPEVQTDPRGPRTNSAGVRIVTADSLSQEVLQSESHALIAFVSPTCGHCKRFNVLFNRLAEFLRTIEWNSFLQLYRMDVSTNDLVLTDVTVRWLPDLYYVSPGTAELVQYNKTSDDDDEGGAGTINDTIDFLEWFLTVSGFTDARMKELGAELASKF